MGLRPAHSITAYRIRNSTSGYRTTTKSGRGLSIWRPYGGVRSGIGLTRHTTYHIPSSVGIKK